MISKIGVWTIRIMLVLSAIIAAFMDKGRDVVVFLIFAAVLSFLFLDGGDD